MGITASDINKVELAQTELWENGPPDQLFKELRGKCPVHWSDKIEQYPEEAGWVKEPVDSVPREPLLSPRLSPGRWSSGL